MSGYGVFSQFYDSLTSNVEYKERADYICTLLSDFGINSGTVIDLACGTGSISFELIKHGFDIIGIDASPEMLCIAQKKACEMEIDCPLFLCQQLQELDLYGTSEAAICTLDSINHLTDLRDIKKAFERLHYFLNPSGIFIFDVNTLYKHRNILSNNTFVQDYGELYCVWQNSFDENTDIVEINLDFFEQEDGVYYRSSESFCERAYALDDLSKWLNEAGFEVLNIYEELTKEAVGDTTQRAVFVVKKI